LLTVDLEICDVRGRDAQGAIRHPFAIDPDEREMLLSGLDAIDRTWQHRAAIDAFEAADRLRRPWVWGG
jgi:3-isopropylmalate/(R)-2-methylmalate dehydratase small subunit